MKIGTWVIPDTPDALIAFAKRLASALEIKQQQLYLTDDCNAKIQGSGFEPYDVTLNECTCSDFAYGRSNGVPCKHIIRLAIETGQTEGIPAFDRAAFSEYCFDSEIEHIKDLWMRGVLPASSFHKMLSVLLDVDKEARKLTSKAPSTSVIQKQRSQPSPARIANPSFAITGTPTSDDRLELIEAIIDCGYICSPSCSKRTSFLLVLNDPNHEKIIRAKSLGIPIINEAEARERLRDGTPFV